MTPLLQLENVRKAFAPSFRALDDVSLAVAPGECLALVGPSGCGKTTLLRVIAGLEAPSAGAIHIDGQCVNNVPAHRREVALLFQRPALVPNRTVKQNLRWAWTLRNPWAHFFSDRPREEELLRVARLLGLENALDRPIQQLSGGQQQRVALGRCLLRKAKLCLLDEPLGQLDAPLRTELRRQIRALAQEFHVTTILVTHDPEEAFASGDRVAVMRDGAIVQIDTPTKLRHAPSNRFVAELVHHGDGGMNLLAGHIIKEEFDAWFECPLGRWPVSLQTMRDLHESLALGENFHAGQGKVHIMIGVAVGDVACTAAPTDSEDDIRIELTAREQECAAAGNWVIAGAGSRTWIGRTARDERLERGQTVTMAFSMARAYWFEVAGGRTLAAPIA